MIIVIVIISRGHVGVMAPLVVVGIIATAFFLQFFAFAARLPPIPWIRRRVRTRPVAPSLANTTTARPFSVVLANPSWSHGGGGGVVMAGDEAGRARASLFAPSFARVPRASSSAGFARPTRGRLGASRRVVIRRTVGAGVGSGVEVDGRRRQRHYRLLVGGTAAWSSSKGFAAWSSK